MSAAAPWSVKGIDPKAREIAKDLARRQGMTLGDWLNRMILEDPQDENEAPPPEAVRAPPVSSGAIAAEEFEQLNSAIERLSTRIDSAERRSILAVSGIDQTVLGLLSRLETSEREQVAVASRFEGALGEVKAGQAETLDRIARVEETASQPRSIEALRALETALGRVASHLYDSETRTRDNLSEMRTDIGGLAEKIARIDETGAAPPQAMIDGVVSRIVQRLEEAEARTSSAIRGLETSFGEFDQRLKAAETRSDMPEQRLEQLAADLTRNVENARDELAAKLGEVADGRFQLMERSFRQVTSQVQAAGHRSTQAMERMGAEVLRMAETLGRRMEGVEARSAEAIEQVGGDVARIADVMESRLHKADQVQAESLERLGAEISRITERLADRIASAERRSAQAIDDVGEQVSRVTERLNQRQERSSSDLAERIRLSEERTARLLEEAREKIDQRLASTERRLTEQQVAQQAAPPPAPAPDPFSLFSEPDLPPGPFEPSSYAPPPYGRAERPAPGFVPLAESLPPQPERSPFDSDDFDATEMFEAFAAEEESAEAEEAGEAEEAAPTTADSEVLVAEAAEVEIGSDADQFDAFERAVFRPEPPEPRDDPSSESLDYPEAPPGPAAPAAPLSNRDLIAQARNAARSAAQQGETGSPSGGLFGGLRLGAKKKPKPGSRLRGALMISAIAATLSIFTVGAILFNAQRVDRAVARRNAELAAGPTVLAAPGGTGPAPQAAVALAPQVIGSMSPDAATGANASALYGDAVRRIESKDNGGLADLRRAANLNFAPAQFYLGKLYESGEAGLRKDIVEARRWTQRAAENGDRKAMHNLGLYDFEGAGGPKNVVLAAQWFRRAADLGLVDSQYNLARLYEVGAGVELNAAEAYKWYLIAARSGDGESVTAADRIKHELSADAQRTGQNAAAGFRAQPPSEATQLTAGVQPDLALAQRALIKLGYYRGPADGAASPALKLAIAAYQRDHGLARTGALDPGLSSRFAKAAG